MALKPADLADKAPKAAKATPKVSQSSQDLAASSATIAAENPNLHKHSPSLALIANLGDPSDPDTLTTKDADGKDDGVDAKPRIVGYRFKNVGTEPIAYMESPLGADWSKSNRMSHSESVEPSLIKPGETVDLTIFETSVLMATEEINMKAAGGEYPATGTLTSVKAGGALDDAANTPFSFQIRPDNGVSIRDLPYIDVITVDTAIVDGRTKRTNHQIVAEFAPKFSPVAENRGRKRRSGAGRAATTSAPTRNTNAEKFLQGILGGKK